MSLSSNELVKALESTTSSQVLTNLLQQIKSNFLSTEVILDEFIHLHGIRSMIPILYVNDDKLVLKTLNIFAVICSIRLTAYEVTVN